MTAGLVGKFGQSTFTSVSKLGKFCVSDSSYDKVVLKVLAFHCL